ncbi:MAG: molybdopterin-dependent oxidoreductase [Dehalococcoidia bacterium]
MTNRPDERRDEAENSTGTRSTERSLLSRARFLALLGGGAAVAFLGTRVLSAAGGWRINTVERPTPRFDLEDYRLVIDGLVERPMTLSYDELRELPAVRQVSDFHCVEGWGVDDVQWDGVRLQTIIDLARPTSEAGFITFHSLGDVYRDSLSLQQAGLPDAMIAYDMDGSPLTPDHGLPLRTVMPRMFGYKGAKWLTRIEFRSEQDIGYWQERGWRIDAWINA